MTQLEKAHQLLRDSKTALESACSPHAANRIAEYFEDLKLWPNAYTGGMMGMTEKGKQWTLDKLGHDGRHEAEFWLRALKAEVEARAKAKWKVVAPGDTNFEYLPKSSVWADAFTEIMRELLGG